MTPGTPTDSALTPTTGKRPRRRPRTPRTHRRPRRVNLSVVPTLFTLGNLVAGFAAIFYASKDVTYATGIWQWTGLTLASVLIFVGIVLDAIDGSVARLTRTHSDLGAQLDSLCDIVTFGVAPAFVVLRLVIIHLQNEQPPWIIGPEADGVYGKVVWGIAAAYVCCAALRLARFNLESGMQSINEKRYFKGLPSPGAAGCIASLVLLHQHWLAAGVEPGMMPEFVKSTAMVVPFVVLLCAFGMISSVPYLHFANRYVSGDKSFGYIARVVVVVMFAILWFQESVAIGFTVYALSGPIGTVVRRLRSRKQSGTSNAGE